jgi:hypothetical protein
MNRIGLYRIMCCWSMAMAAAPALADGDISGTWMLVAPVRALTTLKGSLPPLNAAALAVYRARRADQDPVAKCKPPGEPRTLLENSWPFEIMQSAKRIDFLFQWNRLDRAIAIGDQQPLDAQAPYYFGQSTGRWERDTLVVSVIGLKPSTWLDSAGLPHSDELALTERFRVVAGGKTLEARLHIDDPATYTRPWDALLRFKRLPPGTRIAEDVCLERLRLNDYATLDNSLTH